MWQGSKFPLDQWSVTAITVSGPVELSFVYWFTGPVIFMTVVKPFLSISHPIPQREKKTSVFLGPIPISTSMSKGLQLRKKSHFFTLPFTAWCWTVKCGQSHMYAIYEWQGINNVAGNWCRQWPGSYQSWYVLLTDFTPSHLSGIGV